MRPIFAAPLLSFVIFFNSAELSSGQSPSDHKRIRSGSSSGQFSEELGPLRKLRRGDSSELGITEPGYKHSDLSENSGPSRIPAASAPERQLQFSGFEGSSVREHSVQPGPPRPVEFSEQSRITVNHNPPRKPLRIRIKQPRTPSPERSHSPGSSTGSNIAEMEASRENSSHSSTSSNIG